MKDEYKEIRDFTQSELNTFFGHSVWTQGFKPLLQERKQALQDMLMEISNDHVTDIAIKAKLQENELFLSVVRKLLKGEKDEDKSE